MCILIPVHAKSLQCCPILCDPISHQAPLSMGFPSQEYCSALPGPHPGDLPNPRIKLKSPGTPALQADSETKINYF